MKLGLNTSINSSQNVDILRLSTNVLRNQSRQREEDAKEGIADEEDTYDKEAQIQKSGGKISSGDINLKSRKEVLDFSESNMSAQTNEEMVPSVPVEQPKTLEKLTIAEPNKPMKIKAEEESKS